LKIRIAQKKTGGVKRPPTPCPLPQADNTWPVSSTLSAKASVKNIGLIHGGFVDGSGWGARIRRLSPIKTEVGGE
jgi:hypothetical protein